MDTQTLGKQMSKEAEPSEFRRISGVIVARLATEIRQSPLPLLAGLLGSLAAIVVMGILRVTLGAPTLPELVAERTLPLLSASTFVGLLVRFQPNSKTTPLALTLLGQFALGILLGPLVAWASRSRAPAQGFWPGRRAWVVAGGLVILMEGVALAMFWPVLDIGIVGDPLPVARLTTELTMLATFVAFVLVITLSHHWLRLAWTHIRRRRAPAAAPAPVQPDTSASTNTSSGSRAPAISRRAALGTTGAVVLAVAASGAGIEQIIARYFARSNLAYEGQQTRDLAPITPTDHFYIVSKNVLDPQVDISRWQLEVTGLVNRPTTWTYAQVRTLPSETRIVTFECIANNVGGHLISTAEWQGTLLQTVLDAAGGVQPAGKHVIFTSVDGYQYSVPLDELLKIRALLAWNMNGAPLSDRHGFPLRAVVPGHYGEQSPKWLTRIEVVDQPYNGGLYQSQGWSSAQVHTMSRINQPAGTIKRGAGNTGSGNGGAGAAVTVAGIAFAGVRGIAQVEVSADNGRTWHIATLMPPLYDQSWVFWQWLWVPPGPGTYMLLARATDGTGSLQTAARQGTVPAGATGWPFVTVQVV
jgi:DMSO/TMAO reductase YedYZ molybdopterin-dependent catalytic subunit